MKKSFLVPKHKTYQKKTNETIMDSEDWGSRTKVILGTNALRQTRGFKEINPQKRQHDDDQNAINKKKKKTNIRMLDEQVRTNEQMLFRCSRSD